jgi:hypothetical protein
MGKYLRIFSHIWKPFLIYDFVTAPLNFLVYEENLIFLSVYFKLLVGREECGIFSYRNKKTQYALWTVSCSDF